MTKPLEQYLSDSFETTSPQCYQQVLGSNGPQAILTVPRYTLGQSVNNITYRSMMSMLVLPYQCFHIQTLRDFAFTDLQSVGLLCVGVHK